MTQPYLPPTQQWPPQPVVVVKNSVATAAMVLGIIALLFCWIPIIGVIAWPLAIVGGILGIVGLNKANRGAPGKGVALAGIITSVLALIVCFIYVAAISSAAATSPAAAAPLPAAAPAAVPAVPAPAAAPLAPAVPAKPAQTVSQSNAIRSAQSYLDYAAFSRTGLIKQLKFEKFSTDDAIYAVDNITVDWTEQADKAAKSYMDYSAFSRGSLIKQLKFEGYTQAQAEHGAKSVGL